MRVYLGDRVVVRYRLGERSPADWRPTPNPNPTPGSTLPALSDITGILRDGGDPMIVERDGTPESIPASAVVSVRVLSRVTVRNSEIRALETAAAKAWPGVESAWIGGWLVRAGGGFTRRANSAVPLDLGARADAETLAAIGAWYSARGLPTLLAVPERLLPGNRIGTPASGEVQILVRDIAFPDDTSDGDLLDGVLFDSVPTSDWLRAYRGDNVDTDIAAAVVSAVDGAVTFASVHDADGALTAIGRGAVTRDPDGTAWLGITALWTRPDTRRRGLSSQVVHALIAWGSAAGATRGYVQVEADNEIAGNWYRRLGFGLHHRSRYERLDPPDIASDDLR